jgi:D-sedoheptulose 7-phosphate isomerase
MTDDARDAPDPALAALYPFLAGGESRGTALLEAVRRSTEDKAREIVALRERLGLEQAEALGACAAAMARAFMAGGRLFAFGNGGSASDAQAVVQLFLQPPSGRPLPALALTNDVGVLTALANDVGFEVVFARQLAALARPGDIALGLSTSGSSPNVLRGLDEARRRGLLTVALAGGEGGAMAEARSIEHLFVVPSSSVHRIQEAQTTLYHVLWELTQAALGADETRT